MDTVSILGSNLSYYRPDELAQVDPDTYHHMMHICDQLDIQMPDIAYCPDIIIVSTTLGYSCGLGYTFSPVDFPQLQNNLITIKDIDNGYLFYGTLAHELRHIWQRECTPNLLKKPANGFLESLVHPAEIDADGYAIYYLHDQGGINMDQAGKIMCQEEQKHYQKAYQMRLFKAAKIKEIYKK